MNREKGIGPASSNWKSKVFTEGRDVATVYEGPGSSLKIIMEGPVLQEAMEMDAVGVNMETGLTREFLAKIHFALPVTANLFPPVGLISQKSCEATK